MLDSRCAKYFTVLYLCFLTFVGKFVEFQGDPEQSIIDCTKALELDPLYFKAIVRRAKAYLSLSKPEEALDGIFIFSLFYL